MKKMAVLILTPEMIRQLFQLGDGVEVRGIDAPLKNPGVVRIYIEGAGWPVYEGSEVCYAQAATMENGKINWNLPEEL